ncbi:MAG: hypothetical protein K6E50_02395 [Lachnospiraceae bacterium]|nr:hypothetical protein [Lachnospiraceae bacterium]
MSALTNAWTEEKIRSLIRKLDEKTGLNGASLPIRLIDRGETLGYYYYDGEKYFRFLPAFLNDPGLEEAAAVDTIRHEYAHYYVDATGLGRYFGEKLHGHGKAWKLACRLLGVVPKARHDPGDFRDVKWSRKEAKAAYNAEDVAAFDIREYLKMQGLPARLSKEGSSRGRRSRYERTA